MDNNEQEMMIKNAKRVYDTLIESFESQDLKFEKDDDNFTVQLSMKGDDLPMDIMFRINPYLGSIICTSLMPFEVPEGKVTEVLYAVNALNARFGVGNFEYDPGTNKIAFRVTTTYADCIVGKGLFIQLLVMCTTIIDEYNDKFFMFVKDKIGFEAFMPDDDDDDDNADGADEDEQL